MKIKFQLLTLIALVVLSALTLLQLSTSLAYAHITKQFVNIVVKYGGVTKPLDFTPSEQAEGLYEAKLIPTTIGSYSLVLNGTIQGQNIVNTEIPLDDVEGKQ